MAKVKVQLPMLLRVATHGRDEIEVEAGTVAEALARLCEAAPPLRDHLFDESGRFRTHVLCFHNQCNLRWQESLDLPVRDGDVLTVMQAVSGG